MNVLMLTGHFAPRLGGVEKHVLRVSQELTRLGHGVTVLTRRWEHDWPQQEEVQGVRVRRAPGGLARALLDRQLDLMQQADAIHCHDLYSYLRFYAPAWPAARPPLLVTFHGYEGYPVPRVARWLRRRLAARAAGVICMGEFICRWYGHACDHVCYGGVDAPAEASPAPAPDAPALYVGRLAPDTGIMDYLETLRLLRDRGHVVALSICGDGPLRQEVLSFARSADLGVTLHGWTADIGPLLSGCRFAFVSGYLTILEAMAHRRLACAIHDNPLRRDYLELFPAAQHMIIADSPESLAAHIQQHLDDARLAAAKTQAAETYARQQTWDKVADLYLDLYRKRGLAA